MSAAEIACAIGLRRAGHEFAGKCPTCGYASGFTLTERDGAILLYCHAGGCAQHELLGAPRTDRPLWSAGRPKRSWQ
jgi:hypothetical protein